MTALAPITLTPDQIRIEANIRRDVKVDKPFWSSIKQDGVLIPIVVEALAEGAYRVVDGQRRTLAAIDGGLTEIPAFVVDSLKDDATRVMRQLVVNDHREQISDADRLAAWESLFDMDVSADAIARKTKAPKALVEAARKVVADPMLKDITVDEQIPLDVMAEIAEFADDPDLVRELVSRWRAWPNTFQHELARARTRRAEAAAHAAATQSVTDAGYIILDHAPTWQEEKSGQYVRIDQVFTDEQLIQHAFDAKQLVDIPPTTHGLRVHVARDWNADGIAFVGVGYVENPIEHGYHVHVTASTPTPAEPVDDEAAKEARRAVLANNKSWPIATEVRRTWIGHLLQRKQLPAGVDLFAANAIAKQHVWSYGDEHLDVAVTLAALTKPTDHANPSETLRHHLTQNPTLAPRIVLAAAIARTEGELNAKDSWRHNSQAGLARYLTALAAWGYGLSELEQQIVDTNPTAAQ